MKIGINAYFLRYYQIGISQYLIHLLKGLGDIDQSNKYVLFGSQPLTHNTDILAQLPYEVASTPALASGHKDIEKFVWEQFTGPAAAHKAGVDIFHIPYFATPLLPRTPTIVTIHDMIPLRLPVYRDALHKKAYMYVSVRAAHKATFVITVSKHAKQDIMDVLKLPPERIRVIYEAAGEEYVPIRDPLRLAEVRERYGVSGRYILYLGGLDQRKNVLQLVRAFAQVYQRLGNSCPKLLIAGNPDKQKGPLFPDPRPLAADLGVTDQIIYHFIREEDKPAVYSGAEVFIFPSLYEGFGLTPLEAMGCGTPVICSNRTSLPEVVGDAAMSINPDNVQEMVEAMSSILTNKELQANLRERSLRRAAQFSWRKAAAETIEVYEEVFAKRILHE